MAEKRPSLQFYPGDWLRDPAVRSVSVAARGLWVDMLCIMFQGERVGFMELSGRPILLQELVRMTGLNLRLIRRLVAELERAGVFSRDENATIYSRRMVRDEQKRRLCSAAGKRGGNPTLKGTLKPHSENGSKRNPTPSSSTSTSSSLGDESPNNPSCSEPGKPAAEQAFLSFPVVGPGPDTWALTHAKVDEYRASYPALDVPDECRRALQWIRDNPTNRKTAQGMPRFLSNWLSRSQNRAPRAHAENGQPEPDRKKKIDEMLRHRQELFGDTQP